ncbi:MAG: hypothetical protein RL226_2012 [Bacteroidota bacterium]|jgi:polyhydroxybutyrate depolymerase
MRQVLTFLYLSLFSVSMVGQTELTLQSGGIERSYILYIPQGGAAQKPLVLNLHGYTSSASQQMLLSGMNEAADAHDFIVVYPQGTPDGFGLNHWNAWQDAGDVDDVVFISDLIDYLISEQNVDEDQVFACGFSNGGIMSYTLACQLFTKVKAIASVAGTMSPEMIDACDAPSGYPIMHIHGTSDAVVPIGGTTQGTGVGELVSVEDVLSHWTTINSCLFQDEETLPNTNLLDMCSVEKRVYSGCDTGTEVWYYSVIGGGHSWPGGIPTIVLGNTNQDIDANEEIWLFFQQVPAESTFIEPIASEASGDIIRIADLRGREVSAEYLFPGQLYLYFFADGTIRKVVVQ